MVKHARLQDVLQLFLIFFDQIDLNYKNFGENSGIFANVRKAQTPL